MKSILFVTVIAAAFGAAEAVSAYETCGVDRVTQTSPCKEIFTQTSNCFETEMATMAELCPVSCGKCAKYNCSNAVTDDVTNCTALAQQGACDDEIMINFMRSKCQKACGWCSPSNGELCRDVLDTAVCQMIVMQCNDQDTYDFMTQNCPSTCNRCNGGSNGGNMNDACTDRLNNCANYLRLCNNVSYRQLLETYCPVTCGFCTSSTIQTDCYDAKMSCDIWNTNGYCSSSAPDSEKRANCAKTCGYCR